MLLERRAGVGDHQIRDDSLVGGEVLLDGVRPELTHVLQFLHEGGVVEDAESAADHGLAVELIREADARREVVVVVAHQRAAIAAGFRRLAGIRR